jgi:hypothetical protein
VINPEAGLQLLSTVYKVNLYQPTWTNDHATGSKVVTRLDCYPIPVHPDGENIELGQKGLVSDMTIELKFRTTERPHSGDGEYTVIKRMPLKWVKQVPGAYALEVEHEQEQYMFIRMSAN